MSTDLQAADKGPANQGTPFQSGLDELRSSQRSSKATNSADARSSATPGSGAGSAMQPGSAQQMTALYGHYTDALPNYLGTTSKEKPFEDKSIAQVTTEQHIKFLEEIGLPMYWRMRAQEKITVGGETTEKRAWSPRGSAFMLALSATESGYGNTASRKNNNYWGVGGSSNFTKLGEPGLTNFDPAYDGYIDRLNHGSKRSGGSRDGTGWPNAVPLLESGVFTSDQMNQALYSGNYAESDRERNKSGHYSYNADANADSKYLNKEETGPAERKDYAGSLMADETMGQVLRRAIYVAGSVITDLHRQLDHLPKLLSAEAYGLQQNELTAKIQRYEQMRQEFTVLLQQEYPGLAAKAQKGR